jgi:Tetratricopeptide repeat
MTDQPTKVDESTKNPMLSEPTPGESASEGKRHFPGRVVRGTATTRVTTTIGGAILEPGSPLPISSRDSYDEARRLLQESLTIYEGLNDLSGMATALHDLGALAQKHNIYEEARYLYQQSLAIYEHLSDLPGVAKNLYRLGTLAYNQGSREEERYDVDKPNQHSSVNLDRQSSFVRALLRSLVRDTQEAEAIAQVIGVPHSSVQDWITGIALPTEEEQRRLWELYLEQVSGSQEQPTESSIQVHILEEPLTLSTLTTAFSALTELSTKYWLIAHGRFADLLKYTQTHDERFVRETGITVGKVSHNSPIDISINLSAKNVAEALTTTIDGIFQARSRLAEKELEVLAQAQALELATQRAEHEQQMAVLEHERQRLALEQQRVSILTQQLELQKKAVEYSLELAETAVNLLQPSLDPAARTMAVQAILPNILQLQQIAGLKIVLPTLPSIQEEKNGGESTETT